MMIQGKKKAHPADGLFLRETQGEVKKILFLTPTHTRLNIQQTLCQHQDFRSEKQFIDLMRRYTDKTVRAVTFLFFVVKPMTLKSLKNIVG
jgi:hypothetical protein